MIPPRNVFHLVLARPDGAGPGTKGLSLFYVPKFLFDLQTLEPGSRNGVLITGVEHKMVRYADVGITHRTPSIRAVQAATYISPNTSPTFLSVSENDHQVPVEGTRRFVERADLAGVDLTALNWLWADHTVAVGDQTLIHRLLDHFRGNGV